MNPQALANAQLDCDRLLLQWHVRAIKEKNQAAMDFLCGYVMGRKRAGLREASRVRNQNDERFA